VTFLKKAHIWDFLVPVVISIIGLGIVTLLFFGVSFLQPVSSFLHGLDSQAQDRILRWSPTKPYSDDLHFVAINHPSLETEIGGVVTREEVEKSKPLQLMMKSFPWNRAVWGYAIERLIEDGGADVVVLDLLLESSSSGDTYLRKVLEKHSEDVVLASRIDRQQFGQFVKEDYAVPSESVLGKNPKAEGFFQDRDGRVGHVNMFPSPIDGVIRTINYLYEWHNQQLIPALATRALMKAETSVQLPETHYTRRIRFSGPPSTYPPRPIHQLFVESFWEANFTGDGSVEGDIVLIGPYGNWGQDYKQTAISDQLMPGPEIHLNAIAALKKGAFLRSLTRWWDLYLAILLGLLATIVFLSFDSTYLQLTLFTGVGVLYLLATFWMLEARDLFIPVVFPLVAYTTNGLSVFGYQYFRQFREKQRIRGTLDRYISSEVASEILDNREDYLEALGGQRKKVTVLFSDIRSFTPISEELTPERLVTQLNEFLTPMTEIIQGRKGRLDKFIGDAIMAVWGDLFDLSSDEEEVRQAVTAALEMLERTEELNKKWTEEGYPAFEIGIGINRGRSVFGNLGAESRMEMTVIGDAVNQAARFEGLTKRYGVSLIVGEEVHDCLPESILSFKLDTVRVKGKTEATEIFGVLGRRDSIQERTFEGFDLYQQARERYVDGDFTASREYFEQLEAYEPFETLSKYYQERLSKLIEDPPDDWEGVWVMESK
jgi:adenylate cyclase